MKNPVLIDFHVEYAFIDHLKFSLWSSSIGITWEIVRNAVSDATPKQLNLNLNSTRSPDVLYTHSSLISPDLVQLFPNLAIKQPISHS